MSTKKKKRPVRRARTTFEVSLEHAQARLAKAVDERTAALMKIDQLNRQIPYLERIVEALTPLAEHLVTRQEMPLTTTTVSPLIPDRPPMMSQDDYLARFMPRTGRVTGSAPIERPQPDGGSTDPDEFLTTDGGGMEILP